MQDLFPSLWHDAQETLLVKLIGTFINGLNSWIIDGHKSRRFTIQISFGVGQDHVC